MLEPLTIFNFWGNLRGNWPHKCKYVNMYFLNALLFSLGVWWCLPLGACALTGRSVSVSNGGNEPLTFVLFQMHRNKSFSPRVEFIHSIRSLKSTIQTPFNGAYLGLQFLNLCFCNCMFDLQLEIEKKRKKSELRKCIYIFEVLAARRIPYHIAEGPEKCCNAAGCKLKCLVCRMAH